MANDTDRIVAALRAGLDPGVGILVARPEQDVTCPCVLLSPPARAPALQAHGAALLTRVVQTVGVSARSHWQTAALAGQAADILMGLGYRLTDSRPSPAPPRGLSLRFEAFEGADGLIYPAAAGG